MALSFDVAMNTRAAEKNAKDLGKSLEAIDKELDLVGKSKGLESVEDDLKKVQRESDDTGKKLGNSMDAGFKKASSGADDFKQEANQTARETAASFDGSAESIGGAFQEVAANAFGAFGPAAGLAGLAVAAGIGGITTTFDELKQKSDEVKQGIIDDFLEVGDALDAEAVNNRVRDLLGTEETRKQVQLLAETMNIDLAQAALAVAGDFSSAGVTMEEVMQGIQDVSGSANFDTWIGLRNTIDATNDAFVTGTDLAKAREDAATRTGQAERAQTQMTKDADQQRWEAYAAAKANATQPVDQRVKMTLDDSAVRNYRPPIIQVEARVQLPAGSRQLIQ